MFDESKMNHPRGDNICPPAHLRVILSTSIDSNMPPPFIDMNNTQDIPPPQADFSAPPPYDVAANSKLPTYEEVQREKQMEGEGIPQMQGPPPHHPTFAAFVTVEPTEAGEPLDPENSLLGTDIMFLTSFFVAFLSNWIGFLLLMCFCHTVVSRYGALAGFGLSLAKWTVIVNHSNYKVDFVTMLDSIIKILVYVAFLFNWIGFLLLMCFCHTVASRYGALAGFGLSLAKWTLIVKHSTELASHENSWLWWLIMAFGILICVRAIIQYLNIKRGWRLLSGTAQERLLFFY